MKKGIFFRIACCLTAACGLFAFSGCSNLLRSLFDDDDDSSDKKSYAEDEWNPGEDALASDYLGSSDSGENGGEEDGGDMPTPDLPDAEKVLLETKTDEIGHKIAYYTDGTSEDLGRVIPLNFTPVSPTEKEGYQYLATLEKADGLCAFYQEIYNVARNFHASTKNVTRTEDYYEIAQMRFSQHGLTNDEAVSVWRTVSLEYPEFFWWGNSVLLGSTSLSFLIDPLYAQASARQSAQTAIENMVEDCDAYLDGTTTTVERALTIHDYVADLITYAYEADNVTPEEEIWAHNIAGGALYGKGVCESYAKTYDYLCERFALPCITATGFAVEGGEPFGHAWNVVGIDGGWYNVDITWNDMGATALSRKWFGTDPDVFAQTHDVFSPADGWSVNYMFAIPALDEDGLTPVRAANADEIVDGKYTSATAPMYPSIEDVCALVSEGVTYETYLYPKTSATPNTVKIVEEGATLDGITHESGTLVINGNYRALLGGYYEISELSSPEAIAFSGNVVLRNVEYTATGIDLGGNTLTTEGTAVDISAAGTVKNGNLTDKTTAWTDVGAVRLNTVAAQGTELRLLGGGTLEKANIHSGVLRLNSTQAVSITTLWYATSNVRLYIDGAVSTTKITIGDITADTATVPEKVTIFVVYTSANDYPLISVTKKTTAATLYLMMYSDYKTPKTLGKAFINLGESISISSLSIGYSWRGTTREFAQSYYQKQANGDVCLK